MDFQGIEIVCPACRDDLRRRDAGARLECSGCGRDFPVVLGIPDLRLRADPYLSAETDREKARMLAEHPDATGFAETLDLYYRANEAVTPEQAARFRAGTLAAAGRAAAWLARWEAEAGGDPAELALLDVGCGTGPLLAGAAPRYRIAAGVDPGLRWLVMARRRLEEAGTHAPLVCAHAEALPFPDGRWDRLVLDSVLENVDDQPAAAAECRRVAASGGWLFLSTPNRWSVGPDPHAGIPAGGWLPDRWVAAWVRRRGGVPPRRTLLGAGDLRRLLRGAGFEPPRIFLPDVPPAQRDALPSAAGRLVDLYHAVKRTPPGRALLERIGPLLHAVAGTDGRAADEERRT